MPVMVPLLQGGYRVFANKPLYHAVVSGEHPCLSNAEFQALYRDIVIRAELTQVFLFHYEGPEHRLRMSQEISSTIKNVGRVLLIAEADWGKISRALENGELPCDVGGDRVNVTFHRVQSFSRIIRKDRVVDRVREYYRGHCGLFVRSGKPRSGMVNVMILMTDGLIIVSRLLSWIRHRSLYGSPRR